MFGLEDHGAPVLAQLGHGEERVEQLLEYESLSHVCDQRVFAFGVPREYADWPMLCQGLLLPRGGLHVALESRHGLCQLAPQSEDMSCGAAVDQGAALVCTRHGGDDVGRRTSRFSQGLLYALEGLGANLQVG